MPQTRQNDTDRNLRQACSITQIPHKTVSFKRSFLINAIDSWNKLPLNVRDSSSAKIFKNEVKKIFGTPQPPLYYSLGSKIENSILTRLRVNMSSLNSHQFQIQLKDSPRCSCGSSREDTAHFLLHCPRYHNERQVMYTEISLILDENINTMSNNNALNILLHGSDSDDKKLYLVARCVFRYIWKSKRFDMTTR